MRCSDARLLAAALTAVALAAPGLAAPRATVAGSGLSAALADPGWLEDRDAADLAAGSPSLTADARRGWDAMTPAERESFRRDHPAVSALSVARSWDRLSPVERGRYLKAEPGLRARLPARWAELSPDERRAFLRRHPAFARRLARSAGRVRGPADRPPAAPAPAGRPVLTRTATGRTSAPPPASGR